jgi:hypothetical protein
MEILTYPDGNPINWADPPSATVRVSSDLICGDGRRFTGSMRTVCHMAWLMEESVKDFGGPLHVIQPPYHVGYEPSAGTHDLDACSDVAPPPGVPFDLAFQTWLRKRGFDCWWRHTGDWADRSDWHYHGFTHPAQGIAFATKVGKYVDGGISTSGSLVGSSQIADYMNHAFGLKYEHVEGSDGSWFPADPHAVAFDLAAFIRAKQEELMEYKDWSDQSKSQLANDIAGLLRDSNTELLQRTVVVRNSDNTANETLTVKQAVARGANAVAWVRSKTAALKDLVRDIDTANG